MLLEVHLFIHPLYKYFIESLLYFRATDMKMNRTDQFPVLMEPLSNRKDRQRVSK